MVCFCVSRLYYALAWWCFNVDRHANAFVYLRTMDLWRNRFWIPIRFIRCGPIFANAYCDIWRYFGRCFRSQKIDDPNSITEKVQATPIHHNLVKVLVIMGRHKPICSLPKLWKRNPSVWLKMFLLSDTKMAIFRHLYAPRGWDFGDPQLFSRSIFWAAPPPLEGGSGTKNWGLWNQKQKHF